jgi:hypothetical protein
MTRLEDEKAEVLRAIEPFLETLAEALDITRAFILQDEKMTWQTEGLSRDELVGRFDKTEQFLLKWIGILRDAKAITEGSNRASDDQASDE